MWMDESFYDDPPTWRTLLQCIAETPCFAPFFCCCATTGCTTTCSDQYSEPNRCKRVAYGIIGKPSHCISEMLYNTLEMIRPVVFTVAGLLFITGCITLIYMCVAVAVLVMHGCHGIGEETMLSFGGNNNTVEVQSHVDTHAVRQQENNDRKIIMETDILGRKAVQGKRLLEEKKDSSNDDDDISPRIIVTIIRTDDNRLAKSIAERCPSVAIVFSNRLLSVAYFPILVISVGAAILCVKEMLVSSWRRAKKNVKSKAANKLYA